MTARCALYMDALKNFGSISLATLTATSPEIVNDCCCDRWYESAPDGPYVGVSHSKGLKLFGREIIFEEFQPM